ncbi:MAG: site-2 protease family protein [Proteocatella sp.]
MLNNMLLNFLISVPGIIIAISFHEFAHAAVAYVMGDPTAKNHGRMTINPVSHIDPIGLLMLAIARFGWAKPVPVNESNFRNRALGNFLVSIAGISMNILIAIVTFILLHYTSDIFTSDAYYNVMYSVIGINISFAAFNLLPIPPLDGSKLLLSVIPAKYRYFVYKYENYGMVLMILLIVTGTLGIVLNPVVNAIISFINTIINIIL